jgi:uncharacterized repeat protein (TIGR03806 family)
VRRASVFFAICLLAGCGQAERAVTVHAADLAPALLSEWGVVFTRGQRLELHPDAVPYELNTPLFSDYALKLRTIWMPPGMSAQYEDEREFTFPVGTIISKTFFYEKAGNFSDERYAVVMTDEQHELPADGFLELSDHVLVETRLLVRYADGWRGFPYVWNAAQSDATLEIAGDVRAIELVGADASQDIHYVVPDANQCAGCHTPDHSAGELRPLGPKAWQLNRPYTWWGDRETQLRHWEEQGLLQRLPAALPTVTQSQQQQVKAYLDANCAHCHNPAGAADTSALHLNIDAPVDRHYGVCKTPIAVGRGSGDRPYDIYPGRPDDSILVYRMQHSDPAIAMPELGRSAIHKEGVALVREWIAAMTGDC